MKLFSVDSPFYRFMVKLLDVIKLNFMWILFSLPIVTIGASTVAAMTVALRMVDDEEGYVCRSFVKAFKENWKQGIVLGLISIVAIYAVYLDFQLFEAVEGNPILFLMIGMVSCFVVVMCLIYAFPLLARYENTLIRTIQNSFRIARKYYGRTIMLLFLLAVEYVVFNFNTMMLFVQFLVGPAIIFYTIAGISKRIFLELEKEDGAVVKKSSLPTETTLDR